MKIKEYKYFISAAIILFLAVVFLFIGIKKQLKYSKSENWPSVEGEITSFQERHFKVGGKTGTKDAVVYDVIYQYIVKGKEYVNSDISYKDISQNLIKLKFENVENIDVFYNPESPEKSVLIKGSSFLSFTG